MIVIMGSPGSGKTSLAHILQRTISDSCVISCGDLYRRNYNNKDLEYAKSQSKDMWILALQKFIIDELRHEISKFPNTVIIVDGLWADNLEQFKQHYTIEKLYYVNCTKDDAIKHLLNRGRVDDYYAKIIKRVNSYFDREQYALDLIKRIHNDVAYV